MRTSQLEGWILAILDRVARKQPVEDVRVELKAQPPEHEKAARRIAGHANAAQGDDILWVVGVDEAQGVCGVSDFDPAEWYAGVQKHFDGLAPGVRELGVSFEGRTVFGLLFDTGRAPYVVANPAYGRPNGGPVAREVPWREGTAIRSAKREDLLRILLPAAAIPEIEVRSAELNHAIGATPPTNVLQVKAKLYAVPHSDQTVVIPFHRCEARIEGDGSASRVLPTLDLAPMIRRTVQATHILSDTIASTPTEVLIHGPGMINLTARYEDGGALFSLPDRLRLRLTCRPVAATRRLEVEVTLQRTAAQDRQWSYAAPADA